MSGNPRLTATKIMGQRKAFQSLAVQGNKLLTYTSL